MKRIMKLLVFVCLMTFVDCRYIGPLDLTVQVESGYSRDRKLIIKNNETKSLTDVTITITPENSGNEFFYNTEKIAAKEEVTIRLSKFKDDGGDGFHGTVGMIKIECDQGRWKSDSK